MRVLLIEDGYWDAQAYVHRLKAQDAWVVHAETVEEAIGKIRSREPFDGIITDVRKRSGSGLHLIEWVNKNWPGHPPILVHSSNDFFEDLDLRSLNFHTSNKVSFATKARVMRGDDDDDYSYLGAFLERLRRG